MTNVCTPSLSRHAGRALLALLGFGSLVAQAQDQAPANRRSLGFRPSTTEKSIAESRVKSRPTAIPYLSNQGENVAGTYTDLGTTGTVITTPTVDDANSTAQNIGFPFSYNGVSFSQFVLNTNGLIKLGAVAPTAANDTEVLLNSTDANIMAPASGIDLDGAADQTVNPTEFRVATTGAAGSRVCTIQFENLRDKATLNQDGSVAVAAQFATMQFQVKLYEGTNTIEFVYGTWTATANTPLGQPFLVGLKGNALSSGNMITEEDLAELSLLSKPSAQAWSVADFTNVVVQNGQASLAVHFIRNTFLPDAGRTYRFRVAPVLPVIYTLGKALTGAPQVIQAVVFNPSSTPLLNVPVLLNVTGANTFTDAKIVPSLASGASATVSFNTFTPTVAGNNTITVSVTATSTTASSSQAYAQAVTANNLSYLDDSQPVNNALSISSTTPNGLLAVKYTVNGAATVGEVRVNFPALATPPTTASTYQVVVLGATNTGTPGAVLFTSATQTRPATAGVVTIPVTGTVTVNGPFFVGVKEITGGISVGFQIEEPLRQSTFYFQLPGTTTWSDVATTTLPTRLAIEAGFSSRVLATNSAALSKAIAMFPNPGNGQITLDIRGAKPTGAMQVQVLTMLGQVVHTAAVYNNTANKLDLSGIASGMYMLKVQTGKEFTTRQLLLTK